MTMGPACHPGTCLKGAGIQRWCLRAGLKVATSAVQCRCAWHKADTACSCDGTKHTRLLKGNTALT